MSAVRGVLSAGGDFELLERVREGQRKARSVEQVAVRRSIEVVLDAVEIAAGCRNEDAGPHPKSPGGAGLHRSAAERDQVRWLPAVEWEIDDALGLDDSAH